MRLLGGAAVTWPLAAGAQQTTLPVIGYLSSRSPSDSAHIVAAFRQGLQEAGFVEGQNVTIESRFAEGHFDRLPALADDLVRRQVNVLVATGGTVSVVKAKPVVPATIPIVFAMGGDPVKLGVVASLARTGGNITGVSFLVNELAAKSVELLHELVPKATVIGFLVNPNDPNAESDTRGAQTAADAFGLKLVVAKASTASAIESAFTTFVQQQVAALFVDTEPFFTDQRANIVALAARHALPAVYQLREFAAAGGLITYGTSITDANRQLGIYTGRVLKGTKPADLPVMQSMKFELIINLKTAKALELTIPPHLLMLADEVIQ
jgi:putative ABC transport system substrate-binding protein